MPETWSEFHQCKASKKLLQTQSFCYVSLKSFWKLAMCPYTALFPKSHSFVLCSGTMWAPILVT